MKTGTRILSLVLTLVLALSLLPVTAWADVKGPYPGLYSNVMLRITDVELNASGNAVGVQVYPSLVYSTGKDTLLANIAYEQKESNKLTLTNLQGQNMVMYGNMMGDLTLELVGDNYLNHIRLMGYHYGATLHITGTGSLTVKNISGIQNDVRSNSGIDISAEKSPSILEIDESASLIVEGYNGYPAVEINDSTLQNGIVTHRTLTGTGVEVYTKTDVRVEQITVNNSDSSAFIFRENGKGLPYYGFVYDYSEQKYTGYLLDGVIGSLTVNNELSDKYDSLEAIVSAGYTPLSIYYHSFIQEGTASNENGPTFLQTVRLTGSGTGGEASQILPAITTDTLSQGYQREPYSFQLSATGNPTGWTATGLPEGLTINNSGLISGTIAENATAQAYSVTVTATNANGNDSKTLPLTVNAARTFTVSYDLAGGTGTATNETGKYYDGTFTIPSAAPTKSGYTFKGWYDNTTNKTYAAGATYTVKGNATLRAQWDEKKGVTVNMPDGWSGKQVVGYVWLEGTYNTNSKTTLWSNYYSTKTALSDSITLHAYTLGDTEYTALSLKAYVDGAETVIAQYNSSVAAGEAQKTVTLTEGTAFTLLEAVEVDNMAQGVDYYVASITYDTNKYISTYALPMLVSETTPARPYAVTLGGVYGSESYAKYNWSETRSKTIENGVLAYGAPTKLSDNVKLSGKVTWNGTTGGTSDGETPAGYVTVCATQTVGGVSRTSTVYANGSGEFSNLSVYPNANVTFSVLEGGTSVYVATGGTVTSETVGNGSNTTVNVGTPISIKRVTLDATVTLKADNAVDTALVERYLSALGDNLTLKVTGGGKTDTFYVSPRSLNKYTDSERLNRTAAAASVTAKLTGAAIATTDAVNVAGTYPSWSASFTPTLNPGVVVKLNSETTTGSFLLAYYGPKTVDSTTTNDAYLGESSTFSVYGSTASDHAFVVPAGTTGIALFPGMYAGTLGGTTFGGITADETLANGSTAFKKWENLSFEAGKIVELEAFKVTKTATENATYFTKPNSTLSASADSFTTTSDLILFTGSIGLKDGLTGGRLTKLYVSPKADGLGYTNTAPVEYLVINGKSYTPENAMTGSGYYVFSNLNVSLPCDYSIYCTPGNIAYDMNLTVTADVTWSGGSGNYQRIGEATVKRPGASLQTLSTYVNESKITVSGVAQAGEAVSIYDDDILIGSATGDTKWGEWTAQVALNGTDESLPTTHRLYAVSASGVRSEELTVIHSKTGPQLTSFTMSWSDVYLDHTINIGGEYVYRGGMYGTRFTATFTHPEKLSEMKAWNDKRVVFKVYTTDGEIQFLEADENNGTFTASAGDLRTSVTGAEVLYVADVGTNYKLDRYNHTMSGKSDAGYTTALKTAVAEAKSNETTTFTEFDYTISYNNGNATINSGSTNVTTTEANMKSLAEAYYAEGFALTEVGAKPTDTQTTAAWLQEVAETVSRANKAATAGNRYERTYSLSKTFTSGTYNGNAITAAGAFGYEKALVAGWSGVKHLTATLENDGDSYDMYVLERTSSDGKYTLFRITATFLACDGLYTETVVATFDPHFCVSSVRGTATLQSVPAGGRMVLLDVDEAYPLDGGVSDEVGESEFFNAENFKYNGTFVPNSSTSHQAVQAINEYSGYADTGATFLGTVVTEGQAGKLVNGAGQVASAINMGTYTYNTLETGAEIGNMIDDIERLKSSPCYQKLSAAQKAIFDEAYDEFGYWVNEGAFYRGGHAVTTYVTGAASMKAGNPLTGVVMAGAGWLNDNVGGQMVKSCVGDIIVTYEKSFKTMKGVLRAAGKQLRDPDCKGRASSDGNGGKIKKSDDPSGVVYEGVLENPVAGATVTLYYAADKDENIPFDDGTPKPSANTAAAASKATQIKRADDIRTLIPNSAVQVTGADGKFAWGVPQGLWYVVAHKDGYTDGNSADDTAATVELTSGVSGAGLTNVTKFLPVTPVQLDVNIPLVDTTAPYVESVRVTTDGVYVTFSKYMVDTTDGENSVLNKSNYTLVVGGNSVNNYTFEKVETGSTPTNRGSSTTYTRTVLLKTDITTGASVTLTVGKQVASYATDGSGNHIAMTADYSVTDGATAKPTLATPTFSLASGSQVDRGTTVTISLPDGAPTSAKIHYSTDGGETYTLYDGPVAITGSMTIKAKAVCVGYADSEVASATYTVNRTLTREDYEAQHNNGNNNQSNSNVDTSDYSGGDGGSGNIVSTPASGEDGSLSVTATVSGGTATVGTISDSAIADAVSSGGGDNANLVLDLTSLGSAVETVSIPAASWGKVADALENNDGHDSLTVKTGSGSVTLNENAVSAVAGGTGSVELTIKSIGADGLTDAQAAAVADKETVGAYALGVTVDGEPVEDFGGGFVSVDVPFTPEAGTDALDYLVYRVDETGAVVLVPSAVHDGELTVRSDRLEDIVIVYQPASNPFGDISVDTYYEDAVTWASANGVTYGTGDDTFSPDMDCTRAQVMTFLWRSAGSPEPRGGETFSDVASGSYYEKAVAWAVENGITYGMGDNQFGVNSVCTRAQVVTFLCRMDGGNASGNNPFTDVASGEYYYDAVRWAYANNITGGTGNNQYSPDAACTRAQIVTFLYRDFTR